MKEKEKGTLCSVRKMEAQAGLIKGLCKQEGYDYRIYGLYCYINTDIGLWKINYVKTNDCLLLRHHNTVKCRIDLYGYRKYMDPLSWHTQRDKVYFKTVPEIIKYIRQHDVSRKLEKQDINKMPTNTRKQRQWKHDAIWRKNKRQIRQVYKLIDQIRTQNNEGKEGQTY